MSKEQKKLIRVWSDLYFNYSDLIITHCIHVLKCQDLAYKYIQLISINYKLEKIIADN